jgi:hypothetical protein
MMSDNRDRHVKPRRPPGNAAKVRLPWRGLAMALLLLLGAMVSTHAQIGGGHGRRQNNQQQTRQQSPAPTTPFLPEIWPRLEEGALICKSRDDLVRYQTQIANGSSATTPRTGARLPYYPEADGHPDSGSRRSFTHSNRDDGRVQRDLVDQ